MARQKPLIPLFLTALLLTIYLLTMPPDYSWANSSADSGDLIIAATTGGVPHPTGYPTYLLLARAVQILIPFGTLPFKTHLLSALMAVLAALIIYQISTNTGNTTSPYPGLIAAFTFALTPLIWSQAVITEVYTLNTAFIALLIYQIQRIHTDPNPPLTPFLFLGLTTTLALGNHISFSAMIPPVLIFFILWYRAKKLTGWQPLAAFLLTTSLCIPLYLTLILRAASAPPILWGDSANLRGLWDLVSGQIYHGYFLPYTSRHQLLQQIAKQASTLFLQLGIVGSLLAAIGLFNLYKAQRWLFSLALYIFLIFTTFAILYNTPDSWTYLLPVMVSFAICLGAACWAVLSIPSKGRIILIISISIFFLVKAIIAYPHLTARNDHQALDFANTVLHNAPPDVILITHADQETFTLWYYQVIEEQRPDLAIIAYGLMNEPWYINHISQRYPQLDFSYDPMTPIENLRLNNPQTPVCEIDYTDPNPIHCYSAGDDS